MKRMLLYNHGGCGNRGCEAIVRSTALLFGEHFELKLASATPDFDAAWGLPVRSVISDTIAPLSLDRIINSIGFRLGMPREQEVARKFAPVIRSGIRSDIGLSIGGDTYCYGPQEHLSVINARLKAKKIPLVLWGCSVEPDLLEGEALEDLRRYDLIVARESVTEEAMKAKGLPVIRTCDPAFFLKQEQLPLPENWAEGNTVGLNVSPLILKKSGAPEKTLAAFVSLVRMIRMEMGLSVALIPHVTWGHDDDREALGAIKKEFAADDGVFCLPDGSNAEQIKGYIIRLRWLVTARTHASVAAYSTHVPTLVIGYSVKARGIARDIYGDEAGHLIPVQTLSGETELKAAVRALAEREREERVLLAERMPEYRVGMTAAVSAVEALSGGKA